MIPLLIVCCAAQLACSMPYNKGEKCESYNVVTDFTVQCFGNDLNLGDGSVPQNDQADFCRRLKVIVDSYIRRNGPFKNLNVDYQTNWLKKIPKTEGPKATQAPKTNPKTTPTTTQSPVTTTNPTTTTSSPSTVEPTFPSQTIAETTVGSFRLPNCERTLNRTYCAVCSEGFVKQFTIFVRRTICEHRCMLGYEEYNDEFGARACRKRSDTGGCVTSWCLRCHPGYWSVKMNNNQRYCLKSCPPGYSANRGTNNCDSLAPGSRST